MTSARVPLVPTSIPIKFMVGILLFPVHCSHIAQMAKLTKAVDAGAPDAGAIDTVRPPDRVTTEHVVAHVRALIERGELRPGDRLPPERELAVQIGVSRPSVRAGLQALSAMGVVQARHGAGTFITDGPPTLATGPLSFMAALHGFTKDEMFEARRVLEVGAVRLAAERATGQDLATIAEEMAGMFASLDQPLTFLVHDITFHRAIARASHNPILASLIEMVSAMFYEQRKANVGAVRDLREAAEMHRAIYQALRDHDGDAAQAAMSEHLRIAAAFKGAPQVPMGTPPAGDNPPQSASASLPPFGMRPSSQ
jgi:GntR family transcriptional repressor for pyruvate dehydrogenase complex